MYSPLDYLIAKEAMRQIVEYEYGETQDVIKPQRSWKHWWVRGQRMAREQVETTTGICEPATMVTTKTAG